MIGTQPIQAAIYAALLSAHVVDGDRVVDGDQSEDVAFPYVQIGETQTLDADVTGSLGAEEFLTLHIWSRQRGQSEVKEIAARIATAFNAADMPIAGFESASVFAQGLRVFDDPDGLTRHGVLTLHIHAFQQET
ncbi:MAG: DUF3168 domain-containing protein [Rhizobiales bacterium]|nr:DUF3168 domain-containing protein [Hyphomicrobiales bacterium]MBN9010812.1 DUF3168 domain-containing protein [Hyphomicrobiales bacterium]